MKHYLSVLLGASLLQWVVSLKYVYGPDSGGRTALIDLNAGSTPSSCSLNLPKLPIPDLGCTSTAFIDGQLVVCGGRRTGFASSNCFTLDESASKWKKFPSLPEARACGVSHMLNNGSTWWISGGYVKGSNVNSGLFYNSAKGAWEEGQSLPMRGHGYCLVTLLDGRTMLLGGYKDLPIIKPSYNYNVYILDGSSWIRQEGELNSRLKRFGFSQACARTKNGGVLILGGKPNGRDHVEIWDPEFGFWSLADENLPVEHVWYPASALDEEGNVYIIGGESPEGDQYNVGSDSILKWDGENWTVNEDVLPFPIAFSPITALSPESKLSC
eukprot:TRINITY_DN18135_c0_g1_i1.p1 TRINITY_DN18135_c0_g1~~TRINITY_DN18135_c0_g1_i1.p1  ORF type:complete len:327 (-),score=50.30 TRINITY_DN18135_c0_g1_i1:296-1276(-)